MKRVFYHNVSANTPCPDGIAAAWVCHRVMGDDAEFLGCEYQGTIPNVQKGDQIYIVDFSFPASVLEEWKTIAHSVIVLDHHENKMKELMGIASIQDIIRFDNSKCGALLTWEYFYPHIKAPAFLRYVDDRDRWVHALPYTHEIHAAVGKLGRTFEVFDSLAKLSEDELIGLLRKLGEEVLADRRKKVEAIATRYCLSFAPDGSFVPIVRLEPGEEWATSDVCSLLYKRMPEAPFVATVAYKPDGTESWSLRSDQDNPNAADVAAIAASLGGGGHKHAAGVRLQPHKTDP